MCDEDNLTSEFLSNTVENLGLYKDNTDTTTDNNIFNEKKRKEKEDKKEDKKKEEEKEEEEDDDDDLPELPTKKILMPALKILH